MEIDYEISLEGENEHVKKSWHWETDSEISLKKEPEHEAIETNRSWEEEEDEHKGELWYEETSVENEDEETDTKIG